MESSAQADVLADPAANARGRTWQMLIGGDLVSAHDGETYATIDPSTEEQVGSVPAASATDVARAARAAAGATSPWAETGVRERARLVRKMAEILLDHEAELATLDALDGGNPITAMRSDVRMTAEIIETFANMAFELRGQTVPGEAGELHYSVREPYGVVARIGPYNHPLLFAAARAAAPLMAGNCLVVKAADQTPLSALRLGELMADVFPPGVFNVVSGHGSVAGDALVRHPDVRRIGFVGSVSTGQAIQRAAAESGIKYVTLELGGKNPVIVFQDADLEEAAEGIIHGMNFRWTAGQSCGSTSRLLVHESIKEELLDRMVRIVESIRVGPALDPETEMGPLVSDAQRRKVLGYVAAGLADGGVLLTGGARPSGDLYDRGYYVAPTIVDGVTSGSAIAQEEIFGPVLVALSFNSEGDAVRLANDTSFGLTAGIWTADIARAHRVAHRVEAGYVWLNSASKHHWATSFGGRKDSGIGREEGQEELESMTQAKTVNLQFEQRGGR